MKRAFWSLSVVACALVLIVACGKSSPTSPAAPSASAPAGADAAADGSTLKATAPTPQSPINGGRITQGQPVTLVVTTPTLKYLSGMPLSVRFEVKNAAGAVVETTLVPGDAATTSRSVAAPLEGDQTYQWRARAEYQGTYFGPWSAVQSFVAPANDGYIRGNELYDPLVNGKTIGEGHDVSFVSGVGLRLNSQTSWVRYQLQQPLTVGEFSVLITNIANNTTGLKTKVFSMSEGDADMTPNVHRFTIEKRGSTEPGSIAWRVIANGGAIETIGNERQFVNFTPSLAYLWRATWGNGNFNLNIKQGGVSGQQVYDFSRGLKGEYDPNPHVVFLGSPPVSSGPDSQTVPGIVLRQVWVSSRPRPSFANQ